MPNLEFVSLGFLGDFVPITDKSHNQKTVYKHVIRLIVHRVPWNVRFYHFHTLAVFCHDDRLLVWVVFSVGFYFGWFFFRWPTSAYDELLFSWIIALSVSLLKAHREFGRIHPINGNEPVCAHVHILSIRNSQSNKWLISRRDDRYSKMLISVNTRLNKCFIVLALSW